MNRESSRMSVSVTDRGSVRWIVVELRADPLDDRDGVLAHRAPDVEHDRRLVAAARRRWSAARSCLRRGRCRRRGSASRSCVATTMLLKSSVASMRPSVRSSSWPLPCSTVPPGISTFSATTASRTWAIDSPYEFSFSMSTTMWISRARPPAKLTCPTPLTVWIDARDLLVGQLGQRAQAHRLRRHDERHHRVGVRVDLGDDGRQQLRRHVPHRAGDLLADVVGGVVEVALEDEPHRDLAAPFGDPRLNLVDARDAADRLLHRLDDRGGDLVGARAGQRERHADGRGVGLREQIHAERAEREDAEHDERHHEHRREDGTADAEFRQHRRCSVGSELCSVSSAHRCRAQSKYHGTLTRVRRPACRRRSLATGSPAFTPSTTSTRSPSRSPDLQLARRQADRRSPRTRGSRRSGTAARRTGP